MPWSSVATCFRSFEAFPATLEAVRSSKVNSFFSNLNSSFGGPTLGWYRGCSTIIPSVRPIGRYFVRGLDFDFVVIFILMVRVADGGMFCVGVTVQLCSRVVVCKITRIVYMILILILIFELLMLLFDSDNIKPDARLQFTFISSTHVYHNVPSTRYSLSNRVQTLSSRFKHPPQSSSDASHT